MEENQRIDLPRQLNDIAAIIAEEIGGMNDKLQTRFQLHQLFKDLLMDKKAIGALLVNEDAREDYLGIIGKAIDAEVEEFQRFQHRFELMRQSLLLHARLIGEGRQGIDF